MASAVPKDCIYRKFQKIALILVFVVRDIVPQVPHLQSFLFCVLISPIIDRVLVLVLVLRWLQWKWLLRVLSWQWQQQEEEVKANTIVADGDAIIVVVVGVVDDAVMVGAVGATMVVVVPPHADEMSWWSCSAPWPPWWPHC